jgi:hypothetical protein
MEIDILWMRVWSAEGDAANQQVMQMLFKIIYHAADAMPLKSIIFQGNNAIIFKNVISDDS